MDAEAELLTFENEGVGGIQVADGFEELLDRLQNAGFLDGDDFWHHINDPS